jgi:hypothetical protein
LTNNLYGTKVARIVLEGGEAHLAGKEVIDLNSNKITIVHIIPQTLLMEAMRFIESTWTHWVLPYHSNNVEML